MNSAGGFFLGVPHMFVVRWWLRLESHEHMFFNHMFGIWTRMAGTAEVYSGISTYA